MSQRASTSPPQVTEDNSHLDTSEIGNVGELGLANEPVGFDQASDGRFYPELGIPTVVLGPGDAGFSHTAGEHVAADELVAAVRLYAGLATRYLSRTG